MSPPLHISYFQLLPTTGLQVNTSSKPSKPYQYYRSTCPHLAMSLIIYYYLLQIYRSTRRENPQNHTLLQVNMSPPSHISYSLLLPVKGLYVNTIRTMPLPQGTMSPPRKTHRYGPPISYRTTRRLNTQDDNYRSPYVSSPRTSLRLY